MNVAIQLHACSNICNLTVSRKTFKVNGNEVKRDDWMSWVSYNLSWLKSELENILKKYCVIAGKALPNIERKPLDYHKDKWQY